MYHFFVRLRLRELFRRLDAGDFEFVKRQFHPSAEHWFSGDHALAGRRTTPSAIAAWYGRLAAVFPGLRFEVHDMFVSGPPWRTRAAIEWSDEARDREGRALPNRGMFLIHLAWGRATALHVYCDTSKLEKNLGILVSQGVSEAGAAPIVG